ncbi:MAG: class I SAM-dependent methyltransferase [Candidatus Latescibacteria bacterium]|jgi:SAM-dependent methyltransferase|nr:class I SAM-dependent methyltransferase [Candidatus Latescibacterota bacterium]
MARRYDPDLFHRHRNPVIRWLERMRVSAVVGSLGARPRDRILEVGCGAGNLLKAVPFGSLHGTDLSTYVLGKARRFLTDRAVLTRSSGECLPYRDACFDRAYCSEVLEHVADPARAVAEMVRVLKPGGVLVLSVPNDDWVDRIKSLASKVGIYSWAFESGDFRSPESNAWHLHRFDAADLRRLAGSQLVCGRMLELPSRAFPIHFVAVLAKPASAGL